MNNTDNESVGIDVSFVDGINIVKFDRMEKKNAITRRMYDSMSQALISGDRDASVRVHLFLGGPGVFTSGNDLSDFVGTNLNEAGLGQEVLSFLEALITTEKPLIAAVDGAAIGIGTTLLMHCDLVYATPRSFFQTPFVDLGLVPEAASSLVAPRLFGPQRAFSLLALGQRWSAQEAADAGLVNGLLDEQEIESKSIEVARELARKPQQALTTTRRLLKGDPSELLERVDEEAEHFSRHLCSDEAQAAFSRFFRRR